MWIIKLVKKIREIISQKIQGHNQNAEPNTLLEIYKNKNAIDLIVKRVNTMIRFLKFIKLLLELRFVVLNKILFKYKKKSYATFLSIRGKIRIPEQGQIRIGNQATFNASPNSYPIGGETRIALKVNRDAILRIGDYSGISNATNVCFDSVTIGNYVKIKGSVQIYDTDFHALDFEQRKDLKTGLSNTKLAIIGNDCIIGTQSIILKVAAIGEKSIVGAGSVITKSVPENESWAGNPAKFIISLNQ